MSPSMTRLVNALKMGARTIEELALAAFVCEDTARQYIAKLRRIDPTCLHVCRWKRGASGPPRPVYRWGLGIDAARPRPLPSSVKCKRYRQGLRDKFGPHYGVIHAAQKKHIPGREIVSDGKVIYAQ